MTPTKSNYAKVDDINKATYGKCANHDQRIDRTEYDITGLGVRLTTEKKEIDDKIAQTCTDTSAQISKIYGKLDEAKNFAIAQLILLIIALLGFIGTILWESTRH